MKRMNCETHSTSGKLKCSTPDVSDDESFDTEKKNSTNVVNKKTVDSLNNMADPLNVACNLEHIHDISDDLSTSEDAITIEDSPKKKLPASMFQWNEPNHFSKPGTSSRYWAGESTSRGSRFRYEEVPEESSYKRQKFTSDVVNLDDDDDDATSTSFKEEAPQVIVQHDIMIAGTNIKFPAKPYPCQIAVINTVIIVIVPRN